MNTLGDLIYNVFEECKKDSSNFSFAEKFTNALEIYFESGYGTTVDSGTISSGYFLGNGNTTKIKGDVDSCKTIIYDACEVLNKSARNGNYILSSCISNALKMLCSGAKIECDVVGKVTQGSSTTDIVGTSLGNFTITTNTLLNNILTIFNDFNVKTFEDNEEYHNRIGIGTTYIDLNQALSYRIATEIKTCLNEGILNTNGKISLFGAIGFGNINFGE